MKFVFSSLVFASLAGQAHANDLNCANEVMPCIELTTVCLANGMVEHCLKYKGASCGHPDEWSHINGYPKMGDLVDFAMVPVPETCVAPEGVNGCVIASGNGVKWENAMGDIGVGDGTKRCVTVNPDPTDNMSAVQWAIKKTNVCTNSEVDPDGWQCVEDDCICGGMGDQEGCVKMSMITCPPPAPTPGMMDDPHMNSWGGEWFDYMGECDLVLMSSPKFDGKQDLDVHVRTTIKYHFSYIEAAVLKIGKDTLEVGGWGDFALNGVDGALRTDDKIPKVGGYEVYYTMKNKKKHIFDVVITENLNVTLSTYKDWVSVKFEGADEQHFGSVSGMMGTFGGEILARDGTDLRDDIDRLGQDWQVRPEEGNFFRTIRGPQYPDQCRLPKLSSASRRLGDTIAEEAAEKACAHLKGHAFSFCVHDVMASGDLEIAEAGDI